jgi:hypothetical protein
MLFPDGLGRQPTAACRRAPSAVEGLSFVRAYVDLCKANAQLGLGSDFPRGSCDGTSKFSIIGRRAEEEGS